MRWTLSMQKNKSIVVLNVPSIVVPSSSGRQRRGNCALMATWTFWIASQTRHTHIVVVTLGCFFSLLDTIITTIIDIEREEEEEEKQLSVLSVWAY